ncbi:esterase/lipase family protein [Nocardia cyriacigeorgica]|uniref:esterase/lipase family protein n=1 Tax=Nocardia cyriacigeorgica TaxID=135487 RepID=UPI0032C41D6E
MRRAARAAAVLAGAAIMAAGATMGQVQAGPRIPLTEQLLADQINQATARPGGATAVASTGSAGAVAGRSTVAAGRAGFCVFALNYGQAGVLEGGGLGPLLPGRNAVGPMAQSSRQLADFVDRVLGETGAESVDIVAHSQGGTVSNHCLKFDGGTSKVDRLITLGATHHGTSLLGIAARLVGGGGDL